MWFIVSSAADYKFRELRYSASVDTINTHIAWAYDPFGRKLSETVYDGTGAEVSKKYFVYDGWQVIEERDASTGNVLAEYVHGPDYIDDVIQSKRGGQTYYHHTDAQYSTVALTDASGNVAERYGYDPFGAPSFYAGDGTPRTASAIGNATLFTGRTWDPRINLYDYRTRMYAPAIGRFTTPDPLGPWGDPGNIGNAYTYAGNNPLANVDPLGLGLFDWLGNALWPDTRPENWALPERLRVKLQPAEPPDRLEVAQQRLERAMQTRQGSEALAPGLKGQMAGAASDTANELLDRDVEILNFTIPELATGGNLLHAGVRASQGRYGEAAGDAALGIAAGALGCLGEGEAAAASTKVTRAGILRGIERLPGTAEHHVVAVNAAGAKGARRILAKFGIGIDDEVNRVFLPATATSAAEGMYHPSLHTNTYYREVEKRLAGATSREHALEILGDIRNGLLDDTFPR